MLLTAQLYSPATIIMVDMDDNSLQMAKEMRATHTANLSSGVPDAVEYVRAITDGCGMDCAIEA